MEHCIHVYGSHFKLDHPEAASAILVICLQGQRCGLPAHTGFLPAPAPSSSHACCSTADMLSLSRSSHLKMPPSGKENWIKVLWVRWPCRVPSPLPCCHVWVILKGGSCREAVWRSSKRVRQRQKGAGGKQTERGTGRIKRLVWICSFFLCLSLEAVVG